MTKTPRQRRHNNRASSTGHQTNINYHEQGTTRYDNIEPSGDLLREREDSDDYIRIAFQNIRGITRNEDIPSEIDAMHALGIDIMGMSETNCPWTPTTKVEYDLFMKEVFGPSRTLYSSAPATSDSNYQPGGTLLTVHGKTTGRLAASGTDPWGRFCWAQLRGRRDEGIVIICAYRVCQSQSVNTAGPFTAVGTLPGGYTRSAPLPRLRTGAAHSTTQIRSHGTPAHMATASIHRPSSRSIATVE